VDLLGMQAEYPARLRVDNACLSKRDSKRILVRWAPPADASGPAGYRYRVDAEAEGSLEGTGTISRDPILSLSLEGEGPRFLHLQAKDRAGNWGPVIHKRLRAG
jgi:hypothetical protein